jgi:hypothetical protein
MRKGLLSGEVAAIVDRCPSHGMMDIINTTTAK